MGRTGWLLFHVSCIKLLLLCVMGLATTVSKPSYLESSVWSKLATQSLKLRIIITNVTTNIYATMFLIMMGNLFVKLLTLGLIVLSV